MMVMPTKLKIEWLWGLLRLQFAQTDVTKEADLPSNPRVRAFMNNAAHTALKDIQQTCPMSK